MTIPIRNVTSQWIPAFAALRIVGTAYIDQNAVGTTSGVQAVLVDIPDVDSMTDVIFNGPGDIPPKSDGYAANSFPLTAALSMERDDILPAVGSVLGTRANAWFLYPDQSGFKVQQPLTEETALVMRDQVLGPAEAVKVVDGILVNGKYDLLVRRRDYVLQSFVDAEPAWLLDLAGSTSLEAGAEYPVIPARDLEDRPVKEVGGYYLVSLVADNLGRALTETTAWARLLSVTATVWSAGTYPRGSYVSHGGHSYVQTNEAGTTDTPGTGSDWVQMDTLTSSGGWNADATYGIGEYVQEVRPLYMYRSLTRAELITLLQVKQVSILDIENDVHCVTVIDDREGPCEQGSGSGTCGPCASTPDTYCVTGFPGLTNGSCTDADTFSARSVTLTRETFGALGGGQCSWANFTTYCTNVTGVFELTWVSDDTLEFHFAAQTDPNSVFIAYRITGGDIDCNAPITLTRVGDSTDANGFYNDWPDTITITPGDCTSAPIVYFDSSDLCDDATEITIRGSGFTPTGNTVAFSPAGTAGTVTYVSSHELHVTGITGLTDGALDATVTNANGTSDAQQVATVVAAPTITSSSSNVAQATGLFTIHGTGIIPHATSYAFSSGTYSLVSETSTSATFNFTAAPNLGSLTLTMTTACGTDTDVEVANITSGGGSLTLVGHWPLNEGSGGTAHDSTVNANDLSGSIVWDADTPGSQAGSGGCAVVFNNLNSSVAAGLPYGASDISVSFWFKNSGVDGVGFAYGASPNVATFERASTGSVLGAATYSQGAHTVNGASGGADTSWHLYTMTWSGGNVWCYYEDGTLVNSGTAGFSINTSGPSSATINVGGDTGCKMKDIRVYSGVLSPTDVANIFGGSPP